MGETLDSLYGGRSYKIDTQILESTISHRVEPILQLESDLERWRLGLPTSLRPDKSGSLAQCDGNPLILLRYRVVLGLRYHNLRILIHRALLLPTLSDLLHRPAFDAYHMVENNFSKGIASLSSDICIRSAVAIVRIATTAFTVRPAGDLAGAWWYTLYYS